MEYEGSSLFARIYPPATKGCVHDPEGDGDAFVKTK
jgi:hypothetical protein